MSHYHHLTTNERESILKLLSEGKSIRSMSRMLGRSPSTISRELRRNSSGEYWPSEACRRYRQRREKCRRRRILDDSKKKHYVQQKIIEDQWSPEQISGRARRKKLVFQASASTIYRAIRSHRLETHKLSSKERGFVLFLRRKGKRRLHSRDEETRGKIRISHTIDERPAGANDRSEFGHFEADTVQGKRGEACILTLVERKTRFLIAVKLESATARNVCEAILMAASALPPGTIKSITPDRGKEFAWHAKVTEALAVEFFFPPPHAPWARGTNENTNGLLREYLPKKKSMNHLSDDALARIVCKINNRPRKILHWASPAECFSAECCT